jgi:hypothetical protein
VGLELAMQVVTKYNHEIFMLLLLTIYNNLILTFVDVEHIGSFTLKLNVFGALTSTKEVALGLLRTRLLIFRGIAVFATTFSPFAWWVEHEQQFPNISHLAQ